MNISWCFHKYKIVIDNKYSNEKISFPDPDVPNVSCPDDIHELAAANQSKKVYWELPDVYDFSGAAWLRYYSHEPGIEFDEGTHLIVYEATDFMGNIGNCSFSVTVEGI